MRVCIPDLIRVIELFDHRAPFGFAMVADHGALLVFPQQVHRHTGSIGFRVELCAHHVLVEAEGHDGAFEGTCGLSFSMARMAPPSWRMRW